VLCECAPSTIQIVDVADGGWMPPRLSTRDRWGARRGTTHFSENPESAREVLHYMVTKNREERLILGLILRNNSLCGESSTILIVDMVDGDLMSPRLKTRIRSVVKVRVAREGIPTGYSFRFIIEQIFY
jgi:hypothetical protein